MTKSHRWGILLGGLFAAFTAHAALDDYGVVVGRPVAHYLERPEGEGRWPHYVIDVATPAGQYRCVINMFSRVDEPVLHRVVPIHDSASGYGSVFSLGEGLTRLTKGSATGGALDLIRHPGVLQDIANEPWSAEQLVEGGLTVPLFDNLLDGATRVYLFGEPFANSDGTKGVHDIHQNQGNPASSSFGRLNGTWQDGALVIEYPPSGGHPNRTLVLTRFQAETDFSDANGHAATPVTFNATSQSTTSGRWVNYGPFRADQLEISLDATAGNPDLFIRPGSRPTTTAYSVRSVRTGSQDEFIRSYTAPAQWIYVAVRANGATSRWNLNIRYRSP